MKHSTHLQNPDNIALNTARLHKQLEQLVRQAQQHPPLSKNRQIALNELINAIQNSGKLYCKNKCQFPAEVYEDALQDTSIDVCRKIDTYDPHKSKVMTWVNYLLKWRFLQAIKRYRKSQEELVLDRPIDNGYFSVIDTVEQPVNVPGMGETIRQWLEKDPQGSFQKKHVKGCPSANFKEIALRRLAGVSWKQLSDEWGIPIPTLSVFYQRSCRYFAPKFKEYLDY